MIVQMVYASVEQLQLVLEMHKEHIATRVIMSASVRQVLPLVPRQKHVIVGMAYVSAEQPQLVLEMHKEHIAIPVIMCASARQVLIDRKSVV